MQKDDDEGSSSYVRSDLSKRDTSPFHTLAQYINMHTPALGKPASYGEHILFARMELIQSLGPFSGERLLDVGCGNGAQTVRFLPFFKKVIGIDVVPEHIDAFQRILNEQSTNHGQALLYDGHRIPFPDASFDVVVSIETLEHVQDEQRILGEIRRVLKPEGTLIVSVPNKWWPFETHGATLPILPWHRVPFFSWLPRRLHTRFARARIYTKLQAMRMLERADFSVDAVRYLTAPLDRIPWRSARILLRRTLFSRVSTRIPFLAPSLFLRATPLVHQSSDQSAAVRNTTILLDKQRMAD